MDKPKMLAMGILGGRAAPSLFNTIQATAPIAYWPLNETSGTAAVNYGTLGTDANGVYSGATLNQVSAPGGSNAPSFDGVNDYVNIYTTALRDAFNTQEGTLMFWWKMATESVWYDAVNRTAIMVGVDASNYIYMSKFNARQLIDTYRAGATSKSVSPMHGGEGWYMTTIAWNKANDTLRVYENLNQWGEPLSALGVWSGVLTNDFCNIGIYKISTTTNPWKGSIAHVAIWDRELSL